MSLPPGQTVLPRPGDLLAGKYRVDRAVASGGMAAIFAAEHVVLGQRVAIKVLFAESARNPETVERLLRRPGHRRVSRPRTWRESSTRGCSTTPPPSS